MSFQSLYGSVVRLIPPGSFLSNKRLFEVRTVSLLSDDKGSSGLLTRNIIRLSLVPCSLFLTLNVSLSLWIILKIEIKPAEMDPVRFAHGPLVVVLLTGQSGWEHCGQALGVK